MSLYDDCSAILIARRRAWMEMAGMSTELEANSSLADPISYAIVRLGGSVANPLSPSDSEIVAAGGVMAVSDVAEYRLLMNIKGNIARVDAQAGALSEKFSQIYDAIEAELKRVAADIRARYGIATEVIVGSLSLDFMQKYDPVIDD